MIGFKSMNTERKSELIKDVPRHTRLKLWVKSAGRCQFHGCEEEVDINDYQSITEARDRIGDFIENVYNQKRPHSALGYLTPMEFQIQTLF